MLISSVHLADYSSGILVTLAMVLVESKQVRAR